MTLLVSETGNTRARKVMSRSGLGHVEFEVDHSGEGYTTPL